MNIWIIISIVFIILSIYLSIRVYYLRKSLFSVLMRLDQIERKVPVLKP